jgi:hypothetical protein
MKIVQEKKNQKYTPHTAISRKDTHAKPKARQHLKTKHL